MFAGAKRKQGNRSSCRFTRHKGSISIANPDVSLRREKGSKGNATASTCSPVIDSHPVRAPIFRASFLSSLPRPPRPARPRNCLPRKTKLFNNAFEPRLCSALPIGEGCSLFIRFHSKRHIAAKCYDTGYKGGLNIILARSPPPLLFSTSPSEFGHLLVTNLAAGY